jgi:Zn finger protein HypA/HybF involved in hydrogenase expression
MKPQDQSPTVVQRAVLDVSVLFEEFTVYSRTTESREELAMTNKRLSCDDCRLSEEVLEHIRSCEKCRALVNALADVDRRAYEFEHRN